MQILVEDRALERFSFTYVNLWYSFFLEMAC